MEQIKEISSVSIVGTGNVGWHLAQAFHGVGIEVRHILSRTPEKAKELASLVSAEVVGSTAEIEKMPDLILLCIADDALINLSSTFNVGSTPLAHTSGGVGMDVLSNSSTKYGVFYPLQTFSKGLDMEYGSIPFLVEGKSHKFEDSLSRLAEKISDSSYVVNSVKRRKYHLAAVFACNFSNHMFSIATAILQEEGLDNKLMLPLIKQTITKLNILNPMLAQTGPALRDDQGVMKNHLELLNTKSAEQKIYKLLSENILKYKNEYEQN